MDRRRPVARGRHLDPVPTPLISPRTHVRLGRKRKRPGAPSRTYRLSAPHRRCRTRTDHAADGGPGAREIDRSSPCSPPGAPFVTSPTGTIVTSPTASQDVRHFTHRPRTPTTLWITRTGLVTSPTGPSSLLTHQGSSLHTPAFVTSPTETHLILWISLSYSVGYRPTPGTL